MIIKEINKMTEYRDTRKSKLVWDMRVCRKLIRAGCNVIDCKPLKIDETRVDKTRTVLVFEDTPEFQKALAEITEYYKQIDESHKEPIEIED